MVAIICCLLTRPEPDFIAEKIKLRSSQESRKKAAGKGKPRRAPVRASEDRAEGAPVKCSVGGAGDIKHFSP